MSKAKTRKAVTKRFRVTKSGKMMHRKLHLSHFRAKKSSDFSRLHRKTSSAGKNMMENVKRHSTVS